MRCWRSSTARRNSVRRARTNWTRSDRNLPRVAGRCRQCADGRLRRRRTCHKTSRFRSDPATAAAIIGTRSQSTWKRSMASKTPDANAREPTPIASLRPSSAAKKVQTLCRIAKARADQAMTPRAASVRNPNFPIAGVPSFVVGFSGRASSKVFIDVSGNLPASAGRSY